MREYVWRYTTNGLVRLAFAGALAAGLWVVSLVLGSESRAEFEDATTRQASRPGGETIIGFARALDGDTIEVAGHRIRLEGIDAPESDQACPSRWFGQWKAGAAATRHVTRLTEGRTVQCVSMGRDRYQRTLAICSVDGLDINADLVRQGLAWAFTKYSLRYVDVEKEARTARLGIWQAHCAPAWDYRAGRWSDVADTAPNGCAIKGNVSRHGRIYHMPWSAFYNRTRIDASRGERWFCTEAEAQRAGWQPARPE